MSAKKRSLGFCVVILCLALFMMPVFSSAAPIKIGAMFISSGIMGGYGKHGGQAIQMAVDEINAGGGILGRKVEALMEDTKLKKEFAVNLAKRYMN